MGSKESDTIEQISSSLSLFNYMKPKRGEEATEEKFEASKCSFMRLRREAIPAT